MLGQEQLLRAIQHSCNGRGRWRACGRGGWGWGLVSAAAVVAKGKAENREEPRMVEEQLRLLLLLEVRLLVVARQQGIGWGRRRKRLEGTMVRDKTSTQPARCMSLV